MPTYISSRIDEKIFNNENNPSIVRKIGSLNLEIDKLYAKKRLNSFERNQNIRLRNHFKDLMDPAWFSFKVFPYYLYYSSNLLNDSKLRNFCLKNKNIFPAGLEPTFSESQTFSSFPRSIYKTCTSWKKIKALPDKAFNSLISTLENLFEEKSYTNKELQIIYATNYLKKRINENNRIRLGINDKLTQLESERNDLKFLLDKDEHQHEKYSTFTKFFPRVKAGASQVEKPAKKTREVFVSDLENAIYSKKFPRGVINDEWNDSQTRLRLVNMAIEEVLGETDAYSEKTIELLKKMKNKSLYTELPLRWREYAG